MGTNAFAWYLAVDFCKHWQFVDTCSVHTYYNEAFPIFRDSEISVAVSCVISNIPFRKLSTHLSGMTIENVVCVK